MRWSKRTALSVVYWALGVGVGYFAARATERLDLAAHVSCDPGERLVHARGTDGEVVLSCVRGPGPVSAPPPTSR
jgi:hypothetical protein